MHPHTFHHDCHCTACRKGLCHFCEIRVLISSRVVKLISWSDPYQEGCGENLVPTPQGYLFLRACEDHFIPRPIPSMLQWGVDMLLRRSKVHWTDAHALTSSDLRQEEPLATRTAHQMWALYQMHLLQERSAHVSIEFLWVV